MLSLSKFCMTKLVKGGDDRIKNLPYKKPNVTAWRGCDQEFTLVLVVAGPLTIAPAHLPPKQLTPVEHWGKSIESSR